MLGGINAGDGDRLSVRAAAPQLAAAAERNRDLVAGLREAPTPEPGPVFYAPVGGMGALVDALAGWLQAHRVDIRLESSADGTPFARGDADAVIVALPAHAASDVIVEIAPAAARDLATIGYSSVALVTLAFDRESVHRPLDGSGFLVPRPTGLLMTAGSWASSKWAHLAHASGGIIVRVSAGRLGDDRFASLSDDALVTQLLEELSMVSDIHGEPREVRVSRWMRSFPQYEPGHLALVDRIERQLAEEAPNVLVTGAAFRGLGVPACIRQGREAATHLIERAGS